jgi:hypothetical protein
MEEETRRGAAAKVLEMSRWKRELSGVKKENESNILWEIM